MQARPIALVAAAMLFLAAPAAADKPRDTREFAEELASRIERFFLWNDCRPMQASAYLWSDEAESNLPEKGGMLREMDRSLGTSLFGLSRENVISAVRDRFQATHLAEDTGAVTKLYVRAHVTGNEVRIEVSYAKPVRDLISRVKFYTTTWESKSSGEHGRDGGLILSQVMKEVDRFIVEYLRVNAGACEKRRPTR